MRDPWSSAIMGTGPIRWVVVVGLVAAGACSDLAASSPLAEARRSPEALAQAALDALEAEDDDALAQLMVSRSEYLELLWPGLPDRNHVPFEFVWSMTAPRSRNARRHHLSEYGGRNLKLVRVDLGTETEAYGEFVFHKDARMTVRDAETGDEGMIPLMDVLVEMGGGWKFLNFEDDL